MDVTLYFFDSYAIIEIIKANPRYLPFKDQSIHITFLNLVEVINSILQDYGEERARELYNKLKNCVQEIDEEIVFEGLKLKAKYKKRNLSYADCIGYAYAKANAMRFLTGDKEFHDFDNVEFIPSQ